MGYLRADLLQTPLGRRLLLPAYQISEAARYAGVAPSTVTAWHNASETKSAPLDARNSRAALSYLQLIEVAVVAALRDQRVPLKRISEARKYISKIFKSRISLCSIQLQN